jgi:hypothetical protein
MRLQLQNQAGTTCCIDFTTPLHNNFHRGFLYFGGNTPLSRSAYDRWNPSGGLQRACTSGSPLTCWTPEPYKYINIADSTASYPLMWASRNGHLEVVQMLLEGGADVNSQGGDYGNALQYRLRRSFGIGSDLSKNPCHQRGETATATCPACTAPVATEGKKKEFLLCYDQKCQ